MKTVAFDNETHLIQRFTPAPKIVCTTWYDGTESGILKAGEELRQWFLKHLSDDEILFVGHNTAYDFATAASTYPELLPLIFHAYENNRVTDTAIRQQLFDIASGRTFSDDKVKGYSLEALVKLIFDEEMTGKNGEDIWRLRYSELEDVPLDQWPDAAVDYAVNDSIYTYRVWEAQSESDLIRGDTEKTYAFFALGLMQNYGMRTNREAVAKCRAMHEKTIAEITPELKAAGLIEVNKKGKATKKLKPARARIAEACTAKGIDIPLTEKEQVATDKVACLLSEDKLMLRRCEYATAEKMLSTYLPAVEAGINGPITTQFNMAATGRTTSSTPREPLIGTNLQNAPQKGYVRECYYPRAGRVYCAADFSGAELHTLAQTCKYKVGYSVLGDKLNKKEDVHLFVASKLLGVSEEYAKEGKKEKDPAILKARQDAKAANFGFPGGMREKGFIKDQLRKNEKLWTFEEARTLRNAWLEAFPEMDEYAQYCKYELGPEGRALIELPISKRLRKVIGLTVCGNYFFQGSASDGALEALCEVVKRCYTGKTFLRGSRPCNFVHDEIILEVKIPEGWRGEDPEKHEIAAATLHQTAIELEQTMMRKFTRHCPDYPVRVEAVLMPYWTKAADPVFDEKGRLTLWEPILL